MFRPFVPREISKCCIELLTELKSISRITIIHSIHLSFTICAKGYCITVEIWCYWLGMFHIADFNLYKLYLAAWEIVIKLIISPRVLSTVTAFLLNLLIPFRNVHRALESAASNYSMITQRSI